jgi:hypothetical protein
MAGTATSRSNGVVRSGSVTTWLNTPIQMQFRVIDGLTVRFAQSENRDDHALLLSPWPESLLAFEPMWARLAEYAHLVAIDLPGFGHSQRRDALLSPRAMGEFIIRAADAFGLASPHVVGPDIGTAAALFAGERDAVLVDAALTTEDGEQIVKWIEATGKNLTTIYITHGHGDHFFGLTPILTAFPEARAVTAAAVVPGAQGQLSPGYLQFWTTTFPGQIPARPAVPGPLDGDVIDLEGHQLRVIPVAQADTTPSTIVHIRTWMPSSRATSPTTASTRGWRSPTTASACSGSRASGKSRRWTPGSWWPATSARTHPMMTRPLFSAAPGPTSAISSNRWPKAIRPRRWWTR